MFKRLWLLFSVCWTLLCFWSTEWTVDSGEEWFFTLWPWLALIVVPVLVRFVLTGSVRKPATF